MTANSAAPRARRKPVSSRPGDPAFYHGDDYRVDESIGYLLRQLRIEMDRAIDAEMTAHELTGAQWGPLFMIAQGLGNTAAELSRLARVDTGAMTRMLDRLQAKGLLRRQRCAKDARIVRLELTDEGQRICREIPYALSRVLNGLLRGVTAPELEMLKSLIRRMLANAQAD